MVKSIYMMPVTKYDGTECVDLISPQSVSSEIFNYCSAEIRKLVVRT